MTNFEKYREAIPAFLKNYEGLPAVVNGKPHYCALNVCSECDLKKNYKNDSCFRSFVEWLYDEYVEIPRLSKRERSFCEAIQRGWVTRDRCNALYYFNARPYKNTDCSAWDIDLKGDCVDLDALGFESKFPFIKWEDEEPWSIEELLKLEGEK